MIALLHDGSTNTDTGKETKTPSTETIKKEETTSKISPWSENKLKHEIDKVLKKYTFDDTQLSYMYYDPNDEESINVNENQKMLAASTYKLPLAMYYYDLIAQGVYSEQSTLPLMGDAFIEGEGVSTNFEVGQYVPLSYLLEQSIVNSDNTAALMLLYNTGVVETYQYFTNYGASQFSTDEMYSNVSTANSSMHVLRYLYNHQETYTSLIQLMKKATAGQFLQASDVAQDYEVAHKYGEYGGYVHDYGIVYTKHPYLIAIFTDGIVNSPNLIAELNDVFAAYQQSKYE
ncbi:hypothetical protein A4S06_01805 [Erysipelotrichaceae bacterium MTC7]|nr:hypothetical protein A4S06_01805 [Erysipelotrichaceae bacterium MTC7]